MRLPDKKLEDFSKFTQEELNIILVAANWALDMHMEFFEMNLDTNIKVKTVAENLSNFIWDN